IIDDHLWKYPKYEIWKKRTAMTLPEPEVGISPSNPFWRRHRLPHRNPKVAVDFDDRVLMEENEKGQFIDADGNIHVVAGGGNKYRRIRKTVPKNQQADSPLTLT